MATDLGDSVGGLAMQLIAASVLPVFSMYEGSGNGGGGGDGDNGNNGHGPLPTDKSYQGPWFSQQVYLSLAIDIFSFVLFSALRRRLTVVFAPRTRLIQFAPLKDHPELDVASAVQQGSIFSWILPTLRVPDAEILHLVGLDAHTLLQFHKMTFRLLLAFAGWSIVILMPVNYMVNGHIDGVAPWEDGRLGGNQSDHDRDNATWSAYLTPFRPWSTALPYDDPEGPLPYLPPPSPSPQATIYHLTHFVTVYLFTLLTLRFLHTNYINFVKARQLYALGVLDSIPARTVEIRDLPPHLRDDRALADYFERMGLMVESTAVVRHTGELSKLLKRRAEALRELERAWCKWLGNPTSAKNYDPEEIGKTFQKRQAAHLRSISLARSHSGHAPSQPVSGEATPLLQDPGSVQSPARNIEPVTQSEPVKRIEPPDAKPRPVMRTSAYNPFSAKVDTLDELERRFRKLDAAVWKVRGNVGTNSGYDDDEAETEAGPNGAESDEAAAWGAKDDDELDFRKGGPARIRFRGGAVGFVTFVKASSAQIAAQVQHYPLPAQCRTLLAPEPRDIIWSNITLSPHERRVRQLLVSTFILALLVFYIPPLTFLASFLSPQAIDKYLPWLSQLLKRSPTLRALVMNNASAILVAAFNGLLPMALEWSGYLQGLRARSLVEYSVLKKYYLFLVVSVIFVFLVTTSAWGVLSDLANNPMRSLDKIAALLPGARNFSLAYVIFQALAIVPLGLLQLPYIINRTWSRIWTITPREHAELNVPPMLYMGTVYPQALIIFTLSALYGIVSPRLPVFGAIYFGLAYLVNKYKLIFVFYKSYESRGQAFPLSVQRMVFSLLLFQVFQFSLFSVRKQFVLSTLILPLFFGTFWYSRLLERTFKPLCEYVNLQSVREMEAQGVVGGVDATDGKKGQTPGGAAQAGYAAGDEILPSDGAASKSNPATQVSTHPTNVSREMVDPALSLTASPAAAVVRSQLPGRRPLVKDETLFVAAKNKHTDYREPPGGDYFPGVLNTGRRRYGHPAATGVLPHLWLPIPADEARRRTQSLDALEAGELGHEESASSQQPGTNGLRRARTVSAAPSTSGAPQHDAISQQEDGVVLSLRRRSTRKSSLFKRRSLLPSALKKASGSAAGQEEGPAAGSASGKLPPSATASSLQKRASTGELKKGAAGSAPAAPSAPEELLVDVSEHPSSSSSVAASTGADALVALPALGTHKTTVAEPESISGNAGEGVDEEEDEDDDAEEGVYIHRRSMSGPRRTSTSLSRPVA
ncbi:hypothetical protein V8E36_007975 [Tilletia maclaganii]